MNLLVIGIGIGHEKDLIIGYRYRFKFFISCIPKKNIQLVGLPEGEEGSDAAGFLRANLSKWILALKVHDIKIDRDHRVYDGRKSNSKRPHSLIFHVLRWQDSSAILKGARQAYPV